MNKNLLDLNAAKLKCFAVYTFHWASFFITCSSVSKLDKFLLVLIVLFACASVSVLLLQSTSIYSVWIFAVRYKPRLPVTWCDGLYDGESVLTKLFVFADFVILIRNCWN